MSEAVALWLSLQVAQQLAVEPLPAAASSLLLDAAGKRVDMGPRLQLRASMQTTLASLLLFSLVACAGGSKSATSPASPTARTSAVSATEPSVDPTVPSWLPQSCIAYHRAVVQALDCQAVEQSKRNDIKKSFDAKSVSWKAETNSDKARVEQIGATCTTSTESVRADIGQKCV